MSSARLQTPPAVTRIVAAAIVLALVLLPRTSAFAYSGQQYYTDESGCCVSYNGSWSPVNAWDGYDYSYWYAWGGNANHFWYYPQPPQQEVLCPVIHIANDASKSFANVVYTHYNGSTWFDNYTVYQQYNVGSWLPWKNGQTYDVWYPNSDIYLYDTMSPQESFTVDVVSWHYDSSSNYQDCSYS